MCQQADTDPLVGLQDRLGVRFREPQLLLTALTHRSYLNEIAEPDTSDNERLEYLGDALVDFVAADYLYAMLPDAREGQLTTLRAALVCEAALAAYGRQLGLGAHVRLGRGEEANGARDRDAILGDTFEAVVGAMYLDAGPHEVERFVLAYFEPKLRDVQAQARSMDSKSLFQELVQRAWQTTPEYLTVSEHGPDHDKSFVVCVRVGEDEWGVGNGRSKSEAARMAATAALDRLQEAHPELLSDR